MKFKLWDKKTNVLLPDGLASPDDFIKQFPLAAHVPFILGYMGDVCGDVDPLSVSRDVHRIPEEMSDKEAVAEIERIRNTPPPSADSDSGIMTKADMHLLEQHLTDVELLLLEAQNV